MGEELFLPMPGNTLIAKQTRKDANMKNNLLDISKFTPEECKVLIKLIMKVWRHLALSRWHDKHDAEIPTIDRNTEVVITPEMKPAAATVRRYRSFADAVAAAHPEWTTMPVVAAGVVNDIWGGGENECFRAGSSLAEALAWMEARRDGMLAGYVFLGGNVFLWFCDGEFTAATGDDIVPMVQASLAKPPVSIMSLDEMALGLTMHEMFVQIQSMDQAENPL